MSRHLSRAMFGRRLAPVPISYAPLRQVVRRQFQFHLVACQNLYVMFAHLTRQMSQYLMPLSYLHFESGISHAFDHGSINGDHIFFNDITSFQAWRRMNTFIGGQPAPYYV